MKLPFKTVAVIGKHKSLEVAAPLLRLAQFLSARGLQVVVDELSTEHLNDCPYPAMGLPEMAGIADLAVVIGGDGTMLNIARTFSLHHVPLIGVNQGRLGFLTDLTLENMLDTLAAMLEGQYLTERRLLLSARVMRGEQEVFSGLAFNEVVVHRSQISNMVEFEAH
jgi:NAD+ kinase